MNLIELIKKPFATPALPPALSGTGSVFESDAGPLYVYEDLRGEGAPIVFVHGVHAAASSREMAPLFESLRGQRPVVAFDLPGFGRSMRGERVYDRQLYRSAVRSVLARSFERDARAADVVALSLGCEFAATAALEAPELVRTLTFLSPTGFGHRDHRISRWSAGWRALARRSQSSAPLGASLFALLTSRPSIHWWLEKSFVERVDPYLEAYAVASAHQPGARFAPLAFLTGDLFDPDILPCVYERLTQPVLALYDSDVHTSFDLMPEEKAGWRVERIASTKGLPQFDALDQTLAFLKSFWSPLEAADRRERAADDFFRQSMRHYH